MSSNCDLPFEDLIAYADGELGGARLEYTEAHIRACEICRERLAAFEETARLLDEGTPHVDDPRGRGETKSRIHSVSARQYSTKLPHVLTRRSWGQFVITALFIVGVIALSWPAATQAGFGLSDLLRGAIPGIQRVLPVGEEPSGTPPRDQELGPFVTPINLPPDLEQYHATGNGPEYLELRYRNDQGADLLLIQTTLDTELEVYSSRTELAVVNGTEVLILPGSRPDMVARLIWERNDVRFQLVPITVVRGHAGSLQSSYGLAIVEAVSEVQDTRTE